MQSLYQRGIARFSRLVRMSKLQSRSADAAIAVGLSEASDTARPRELRGRDYRFHRCRVSSLGGVPPPRRGLFTHRRGRSTAASLRRISDTHLWEGPCQARPVRILCHGLPAHPLRRRLRSIWPISDLFADQVVVQPVTHPLSPRPRESVLPLNAGSVRSVSRRDVIRSTIYSGSPGLPDVATKPVSKGRHHSLSR